MPSSSDMPASAPRASGAPERARARRGCRRGSVSLHDRLNSRSARRRARVSPKRVVSSAVPFTSTSRPRTIGRNVVGAPAAASTDRARVLDLIGQHVDEELVGRIGRQARAPVAHQVAAHDGQQQQRHQAERQRADLQARRRARAGAGSQGRSATTRRAAAAASAARAAATRAAAEATSSPPTPPTMISPACASRACHAISKAIVAMPAA